MFEPLNTRPTFCCLKSDKRLYDYAGFIGAANTKYVTRMPLMTMVMSLVVFSPNTYADLQVAYVLNENNSALPNILRYRHPFTARAMTHTCSTQHYSNSFPKFSLSKQEVKKNPGNEVVLFKCRKRSCVKTFSSEILHYFIRYLDCKK